MNENNTNELQKTAMPAGQPYSDLLSVAVGLGKHRLTHEFSDQERVFVKKWHEMNENGGCTTNILELLFREHCEDDDPDCIDIFSPLGFYKHTKLGPPTDRDRIVAETVVQWLGTNVGRGFLHECGFTR